MTTRIVGLLGSLLLLSALAIAQDAKTASPPVSTSAQEATGALSDKQWQDLIDALEREDWKAAADYSSKYLKLVKHEDTAKTLARLRYMFLFASAAKVAEGAMTYEDLELALKDLIGKEVETPSRKISWAHGETRCNLDTICFSTTREKAVSAAATNRKGTNIYAFEYAALTEPFDFEHHGNEFALMRGDIKGFQLNPNKSTLWIMRLFLEHCIIELDQAHPK